MEEFSLGGVQSSLAVLCHMVSLIAVVFFFPFTVTERFTKRNHLREKNTAPKTGPKVGIVLMLH